MHTDRLASEMARAFAAKRAAEDARSFLAAFSEPSPDQKTVTVDDDREEIRRDVIPRTFRAIRWY